jgi:formylglycine-generating enzyme required for sulfatase activity
MRQEFESSRNKVFQDYKDKVASIDRVIDKKVQDSVRKMMESVRSTGRGDTKETFKGEPAAGQPGTEKEGMATSEAQEGATKKVSEMSSSGEESVRLTGRGDASDLLKREPAVALPQMEKEGIAGSEAPGEATMRATEMSSSGKGNVKSEGRGDGSEIIEGEATSSLSGAGGERMATSETPGGATKKASEMSSSGEGSAGDFGDEMELAAPPKFERVLTQDYSLSITIPPGEFLMGCDDVPQSDPRHKVIIEKAFRVSKYPITIIQFLQFVKETGHFTSVEKKQVCGVTVGGGDQVRRSHNNKVVEFILRGPVTIDNEHATWKQPFGLKNIFEQKFNHPVTMITWWDCMAYCDWLSKKSGTKCRLPTEKEWEYVASNRGQLKPGEFYWRHEESLEKHCNAQNSFVGDTTPVDQFLENKTVDGVRDMLGNVWEWTLDAYYDYSGSPDRDDVRQEYKVVRGGSYAMDREKINTFIRRSYKMMYASSNIGFRVVSEE